MAWTNLIEVTCESAMRWIVYADKHRRRSGSVVEDGAGRDVGSVSCERGVGGEDREGWGEGSMAFADPAKGRAVSFVLVGPGRHGGS